MADQDVLMDDDLMEDASASVPLGGDAQGHNGAASSGSRGRKSGGGEKRPPKADT